MRCYIKNILEDLLFLCILFWWFQVKAKDVDVGESGHVVYKLIGDTPSKFLTVDKDTGEIKVLKDLSPMGKYIIMNTD